MDGRRRWFLGVGCLVMLLLVSCGAAVSEHIESPAARAATTRKCGQFPSDPGPGHPLPITRVRYFAYQIQGLMSAGAVDALVRSSYDLVVVEPTRTNASNASFDTRGMVARLKASRASDGIHRKLVVAYVDIGEAESYRWYWTWPATWIQGPRPEGLPSFILSQDPDGWPENFPVAFWDPRWKDIVLYGRHSPSRGSAGGSRDFVSLLDEVLIDGFDGVYLDWVEGFEHPPVAEEGRRQSRDPVSEMVAFLREIQKYTAERAPGMLIIQQNGAALGRLRPEIFQIVDAIAQEEVWYDGIATDRWDDPRGYDHPVNPATTEQVIRNLRTYQDACVPVFNVEYALTQAVGAYAKSYAHGYVPYVTRRSLSALTTTPPPGLSRGGTR